MFTVARLAPLALIMLLFLLHYSYSCFSIINYNYLHNYSPERKQEVAEKTGGDSGSESAAAADDDCGSSTASSGFGSLTKKKNYGLLHLITMCSVELRHYWLAKECLGYAGKRENMFSIPFLLCGINVKLKNNKLILLNITLMLFAHLRLELQYYELKVETLLWFNF